MKKIYLALLALTLGVSTQAQRTLKLKLEIEKPLINDNIATGSTVNFSYKIINNSDNASDSLEIGDTVRLFDPSSKYVGTAFTTFSYGIVVNATIPKGGSLTITPSTPVPFANIETLRDVATGAFKSKAFTANTKYIWFLDLYTFSVGTGNTPLAATGSTITSDTQVIWINKTPTGMPEISFEETTIKTYPNPASSQLSFDLNVPANDKAIATIMDAAGRTVLTKELDNNNTKHDLDISSVSTGMYMLRLSVGDKVTSSKFNVQK
jgi:hypothetical protein